VAPSGQPYPQLAPCIIERRPEPIGVRLIFVHPLVLQEIVLSDHHATTSRTRHFAAGVLLGRPSKLQIVRYANDAGHLEEGYFLLYFDENDREQTDTWHKSLADAQSQAEFEFGVRNDEWTTVSSEPG
jgi:hypothetical protein